MFASVCFCKVWFVFVCCCLFFVCLCLSLFVFVCLCPFVFAFVSFCVFVFVCVCFLFLCVFGCFSLFSARAARKHIVESLCQRAQRAETKIDVF